MAATPSDVRLVSIDRARALRRRRFSRRWSRQLLSMSAVAVRVAAFRGTPRSRRICQATGALAPWQGKARTTRSG